MSKNFWLSIIIIFAILPLTFFLFYIFFYGKVVSSQIVPADFIVGELVVGNKIFDPGNIIFSRNSPFAIMAESNCGRCNPEGTGVGIFDTRTNDYQTLTTKNGLLGNRNLFSPSGQFVIYPVVRTDPDLTGGDGISKYYYELYVYNTKTRQSSLLTKQKGYLMYRIQGTTAFPGTNGSLYTWLNDDTVLYTCGGPLIGKNSFQSVCSVDINTGKTTTFSERGYIPNITNAISASPGTLKTESNYARDGAFESLPNNNGTMYLTENTKIKGYDQRLVIELWLHNGDTKQIIYRGRPEDSNFYWSFDDHVYLQSSKYDLYKLY